MLQQTQGVRDSRIAVSIRRFNSNRGGGGKVVVVVVVVPRFADSIQIVEGLRTLCRPDALFVVFVFSLFPFANQAQLKVQQ